MCDHLVDPALYRRLAETGAQGGLTLGIDRLLDQEAVDMEDVTRVETDGDAIVAIGKGIEVFDCFDTGVFAIGPALFEALKRFEAPSLSAGVGYLAGQGLAHVADCTGITWIDVDDPKAHVLAERWASAQVSERFRAPFLLLPGGVRTAQSGRPRWRSAASRSSTSPGWTPASAGEQRESFRRSAPPATTLPMRSVPQPTPIR